MNKSKALLFLAILAVFFSVNPAQAQNVNTYDFAATNGTFTPIMVAAGATAVPTLKANDAISLALPIGFTFNYAGGNYSSVYASSNGFLTFFGASPLPPSNITPLTTASTGSMAVIAPLWADLNSSGAPSAAQASYQTTGAPGSRVFTFQWLNWRWGNSIDPDISFQVKLYEGSDKIEFYYRREALNTSIYYHASIGLAGPSTGSPDILHVRHPYSPPYGITNEGQHNTRPVTGQIYTFTKSALKDIQAVELAYPLSTTCGANVPVTVTVKNMGAVPLDFSATPLTINGSITGPNPLPNPFVTVNTGTLAINATLDVVLVPSYDMTLAGTYTFNATATMPGDGRTNNNSIPATTRTVAPIAALPQNVDFTGFDGTNLSTVFPGWEELPVSPGGSTYWQVSTGLGGSNNKTATFRMANNFRHSWIKGPKVTVTSTTQLRFKAAITEAGNFNPHPNGMSGTDDVVYVMVSTDCGTSFTPIFAFDASNSATLSNVLLEQAPISLAAYAGQTIRLGFFATEGAIDEPGLFDFHLDDIFIGSPPTTDLGVLSISNPLTTGCYGSSEAVTVTIRNFGVGTIDFSTTNAQVQASVTRTGGTSPAILTTALTSGTLAPGATQTVSLPVLDMTAAGEYTFSVYTTIAGDNNTANDTLTATRSVAPIFALPNTVDFTGFTGNNLTTLFPGWWRTQGVTPDPNPLPGVASWSAWTGLGHSANKTAFVRMEDVQVKYWLIGPKIAANATTELRLKIAISEATTNNPYPLGMSGTDDKVQVMVSTNCGVTFSPVYTFDASNTGNVTNILTQRIIPLGSFAGQNIIVALYATDGPVNNTNDYRFHIDDIELRSVAPADMASVQAVVKKSGCGLTSTEQVCVVVKNEGSAVQSNILVSFLVNNGTAINEIIPGPVQPGDTLRYCFTGTADLAANGTYAIKVYTGLAGDATLSNDTITHTVISYNPVTITATGNSRCGVGPVTLSASTPSNNLPINWYTTATGGTAVGTGASFSPTVSTTTTYYAEAVSGIETVGKTTQSGTHKSTVGSIYFDASQAFDLISVVVYSDVAAGGNLLINLKNATNTIIQTTTFALPPVSGKTAVTVPLNFINILPGADYRLELASAVNLYRDQNSLLFPFISPSQTVTLTRSSNPSFYNFFYNWTIALCAPSQRVPVVATINPAPVVNLGPAITQCGTAPVTLDAGNAGATFQWSLNGTAISGATSQTYAATAPGSYSVTITNANSCSATSTVQVSFSTVATPSVAASGPLTFCQGGSVSLTGTTTTTGVTYQWLLNNAPVSGATSLNLSVNSAGSYRLVASLSGCSDTSAVTTVTVNAIPSTPTVTLAGNTLTSSAANGNQWYEVNGTTLTLVPGATGQTFTPSTNGTYTVKVTTNGCESAQAASVNVVLGIASLAPGLKLDVYPNPTNGRFEVQLTGFEKAATLQVMNVTGQVIAAETIAITSDVTSKAFNLSGMAKGVYILKVTSGANITFRKVVQD